MEVTFRKSNSKGNRIDIGSKSNILQATIDPVSKTPFCIPQLQSASNFLLLAIEAFEDLDGANASIAETTEVCAKVQ